MDTGITTAKYRLLLVGQCGKVDEASVALNHLLLMFDGILLKLGSHIHDFELRLAATCEIGASCSELRLAPYHREAKHGVLKCIAKHCQSSPYTQTTSTCPKLCSFLFQLSLIGR